MPALTDEASLHSRAADRVRVVAQALEAAVAFALVVLGVVEFVQLVKALSTTGLWNDEIVSIRLFSSQGLWTTLTTYPSPNNHIFFNALSSLTPWSDPYEPWAARSWSFLAMGLLGVCGVWPFVRRRSLLEAGLLVHLLFMSHEFLALGLQARGYGLISLFAMLSGVLVWRHERGPEKAFAFAALGGVTLLGVWTIPSYALFAGPVMALAGLSGPRRRNALIGLATIGSIALVYAPVASDVLSASGRYGAKWGHQLDTLGELADALRLYLFHDESFVLRPNDVAIGLWWLGALTLALRWPSTAESRAARTMLGGGLFLIGAAYALGTPPPRILVPAVVAFAFGVALILRDRLAPGRFVRTRALLACGLAVVVLPHDRQTVRHFEFVPRERWKTIAEFIDRILPDDMTVSVRFRADQLALYTTAEAQAKLRDEVDRTGLDAGRSAVLLNGLDPQTKGDPIAQDPRYAAIRFKQNRGGHQTLYLAPPPRHLIERVTLAPQVKADRVMDLGAAIDGDLSTWSQTVRPLDDEFRYVELHADLAGDEPVRSLLLIFDEEARVGRVHVEAHLDDGTLYAVPESRIAIWGSAVVVDLDLGQAVLEETRRIESLVIHVRPVAIDGRRAFALEELWVYPERLGHPAGRS